VSEREAQIVGRESELAVLEEFLGGAAFLRALVITGEPGIGKSTLWEAGIVAARERGLRILAARATGAEMRLSYRRRSCAPPSSPRAPPETEKARILRALLRSG